jgi:hypothetical protein
MSPVVNLPAVFDGRSGKFFRIKIVRQIAFLLLFFIMSWAYFEITYEVVRELNILHFYMMHVIFLNELFFIVHVFSSFPPSIYSNVRWDFSFLKLHTEWCQIPGTKL